MRAVDKYLHRQQTVAREAFSTTHAWLTALLRQRRAQIEKTNKCKTFNRKLHDIQDTPDYLEARIKSYEHKHGVAYYVRMYKKPTDETMVWPTPFDLFDVECYCHNKNEIGAPYDILPVCYGWRSKRNWMVRHKSKHRLPTFRNPHTLCIHGLALCAYFAHKCAMGEFEIPTKRTA